MKPEELMKKIFDEFKVKGSTLNIQMEIGIRAMTLMAGMFDHDDIEILKHNAKSVCAMYSQLVTMYKEAMSLESDAEVDACYTKYYKHHDLDVTKMSLDLTDKNILNRN